MVLFYEVQIFREVVTADKFWIKQNEEKRKQRKLEAKMEKTKGGEHIEE